MGTLPPTAPLSPHSNKRNATYSDWSTLTSVYSDRNKPPKTKPRAGEMEDTPWKIAVSNHLNNRGTKPTISTFSWMVSFASDWYIFQYLQNDSIRGTFKLGTQIMHF